MQILSSKLIDVDPEHEILIRVKESEAILLTAIIERDPNIEEPLRQFIKTVLKSPLDYIADRNR